MAHSSLLTSRGTLTDPRAAQDEPPLAHRRTAAIQTHHSSTDTDDSVPLELAVTWEVCDHLETTLRTDTLDRVDLLGLVDTLTEFLAVLERSIQAYDAHAGRPTDEARAAASSCKVLVNDLTRLRRVQKGRRAAVNSDLRDGIAHAVHAARNALALLRCAWARGG